MFRLSGHSDVWGGNPGLDMSDASAAKTTGFKTATARGGAIGGSGPVRVPLGPARVLTGPPRRVGNGRGGAGRGTRHDGSFLVELVERVRHKRRRRNARTFFGTAKIGAPSRYRPWLPALLFEMIRWPIHHEPRRDPTHPTQGRKWRDQGHKWRDRRY